MENTTDGPGTRSRDDWIRIAFTLAMNLPFWALVLWATLTIGKTDAVQAGGNAVKWAMVVGVLTVTFGLTAAAQRASARFLRVAAEAEELRREGQALLLGAGALVASGSSMILLAVAGPDRLVSPVAGLTVAVVLTAIAMVLVAVRRRSLDELGRIAERDSGHLAFKWFTLVGGSWAILAHLGFVAAPTPLHWLSMIWAFSFAGGILAAARKGIFDPPRG
jgi:hypothetical protein